ncbi:MAG: MinD/ParA family protein [Nanoarchaeota archaeon]
MSKSIGIISIKGGVGKTTIASALAVDLVNNYGKKVLLVDANFSAPNIGEHMDILNPASTVREVLAGQVSINSSVEHRYGVDVISGTFKDYGDINILKLKDRIERIKNAYDYIVIDSSPNLNDEMLSTILASDALFVVSTPDTPTLNCSVKAAQLAKQRGKPIAGVIVNKIRDPKFELSLQDIEKNTGIPVVAMIKDDKAHGRALFTRIPMPLYKSRSRCSKEIKSLSASITGMARSPSFLDYLIPRHFSKEHTNRQLLKEGFYTEVFK